MKATRPYGDIFEYDNTPLQPGERRAVKCDGSESNWTAPEPVRCVRIHYRGVETVVAAHILHEWKRTDYEIQRGKVMSTSSGPKDYFVNDIISLFAEGVDAVRWLVIGRTPFAVVHKAGGWFDVSGREVVMDERRRAA